VQAVELNKPSPLPAGTIWIWICLLCMAATACKWHGMGTADGRAVRTGLLGDGWLFFTIQHTKGLFK